ncbi:MAG TPA: MarR family transcriptional regulator [Mycobacteriales bacterium]|nr:MarR family transcriptional regulator [Mycobacteriales bacterium]
MPPLSAPNPEQLAVWRTFLRAHALLTRRLEAELLVAHDLSLASYDVLVQLAEATGQQLRMSELAERVLLSPSGITRLVDRLQRAGLVRREACASDARGTFTVLTGAGLRRLREAAPTHLRGIAEHVIARLDPGELQRLRALLEILVVPLVDPADAGRSAGESRAAGDQRQGALLEQ